VIELGGLNLKKRKKTDSQRRRRVTYGSYVTGISTSVTRRTWAVLWCELDKAQIPLRWLSPKLSRGKSRGHRSWKSATWFVSRNFMICVCDFSRGKV